MVRITLWCTVTYDCYLNMKGAKSAKFDTVRHNKNSLITCMRFWVSLRRSKLVKVNQNERDLDFKAAGPIVVVC